MLASLDGRDKPSHPVARTEHHIEDDQFVAGLSSSFCTRQFEVSATYISFSEGQAIAWPPENCLRLRPDFPITPKTLPSSESLKMRPGNVDSPRNITWF